LFPVSRAKSAPTCLNGICIEPPTSSVKSAALTFVATINAAAARTIVFRNFASRAVNLK
jgi:hypothetical protein